MKTVIKGQLCTDSSITLFHRVPQVGRDLRRSPGPTWSISRITNIKRLFKKAKEEALNDAFKILNRLPLE